MAKKKKRVDPTSLRPLMLAALGEYGALGAVSPPEGSFDPGGRWKNTYQIWFTRYQGRSVRGFLELEHAPAADGRSVVLKVESSILQSAGSVHNTKAQLQCAADTLATPKSWRLESKITTAGGEAFADSVVREEASVEDGKIEVAAGGRSLVRDVPRPFTSNWSLFDAVQRLAGRKAKALEFALLEDMDLVKPDQRLSYWKSATVEVGGKKMQLEGYQQIGHGILPSQYWVDEQHRLLVAICGIRAYILDRDARSFFARMVERFTAQQKRRRQR